MQVLALVAVVVLLCAALAALAGGHRTRLGARTAADLAALAAAGVVALPGGVVDVTGAGGSAEACDRAAEVAARNDAEIVACAARQGVAEVTVVRGSATGAATATARAGVRSAHGADP